MILQALKEYYDRLATEPEGGIAPDGFENKPIPFIVVLGKDGMPVDLITTYEGEGKKRNAKRYLVPKSVKKTSGVISNLLWENPEYALGIKLKTNAARLCKMHDAFKQRIKDLNIDDEEGIKAILKFLDTKNIETL